MKRLKNIEEKLHKQNFYLYNLDKNNITFVRNKTIFTYSTIHEYREMLLITEMLENLKLDYKVSENSNIEVKLLD